MPCLGIFGLGFKKTIVILEISTIKFVKLWNFAKKQNYLNLEPQMPYLGFYRVEFQKTVVIFEITPQIFSIVKFREKKDCLDLGPKMPYLGVFGVKF